MAAHKHRTATLLAAKDNRLANTQDRGKAGSEEAQIHWISRRPQSEGL